MEVFYTRSFLQDYDGLPAEIQKRVDRAVDKLAKNTRHPSLQVEKMKGKRNVWEARVSNAYRMTFTLDNNKLIMRRVGPHDILKTP